MFESLFSLLFASSFQLQEPQSVHWESFDQTELLSVNSLPILNEAYPEPAYTSAGSVLILDLQSNSQLYNKNADQRRPIASITKLMTAHIILTENNLNDVVTVSENAASTIGSTMNLQTGENITVKHLLYGLLLESGNDAAVALAEFNSGSVHEFVQKMNQTADLLGMKDTHYLNPTGLDESGSYSSAKDLTTLITYLLKDPNIREITKVQTAEITSKSGLTHKLENTNILLGEYGIKGLKTGRTPAAGECLITLANGPQNREIITVVLGSEQRFPDTITLLNWVELAYRF